jgi:hypothetical protein
MLSSRRMVPILTLLVAGFVHAQTSTATLQGHVEDSSSAKIPGAQIQITNVNTAATRQASTDADGEYVVPFLPPGQYTLAVEKPGFRRFTQTNVTLRVGQTLALNVTMQLGDVTTAVEVSAAAPPLSTSDSTVQTSISAKSITDLPLNGRLVLNLAATVPGVYTGVSSASGQNDNYTPQIGGGRIASSETLVDGAPLSVADPTGGARVMGGLPPSPDAVQEFTVQVNGLPAEYGRIGGGVLNIATRSGTNALHGTAREFLRNSAFDANNFFANKNGVPLQSFKRNQYGFSLGGPVYLPKIYNGKNRTFFFVDLERTNERSPVSATTTLPLDAWKTGDFSQLRNFNGAPITIYDPLTSQPNGTGGFTRSAFPGNRIPANRINPVAANVIPYWPEPNRPSTNPYTPLNNWYNSGSSPVDTSNLTLRADHSWTQAWRSYWRMNRSTYHIAPTQLVGGGPADYASDNIRPRYNGVWDNTIIVNPTTTVNLRANVTRWEYDLYPTTMGFNSDTLGFPHYLSAQSAGEWSHFPGINVSGLAGRGGGGGLNWLSNSGDIDGSITKIVGKHTIKTGLQYRKFFLNFFQPWGQGPNGGFSFSDDWTRSDPFTYNDTQGFGFASFLLGTPSSGELYNVPKIAVASSYWGTFIQDDIRLTSKLTLNVGLRWDVDIPRTERFNRLSYYDLNAPSPIAGQVPGFPNLVGAMKFVDSDHRQQTPTVWSQYAPRFGFAYQVTPKTVVRGAYGIVYDASPMQVANHNAGLEGFRLQNTMITTINGATPIHFLDNPFPDGFKGVGRSPSTDLGFNVSDSWIPAWKSPMIQQWNFNVQRELPGQLIVEVGYIGNKGTHLQDGDTTPYNQLNSSYMALGNQLRQTVANPFYGVITDPKSVLSSQTVQYGQLLRPYPQLTGLDLNWRPYGNSTYHALTIRAERRFSSGFGFLLAFTGAKLIGDSEASGFFSSSGGSATQDAYNRRAERAVSTEDIARRLTISADYQLPVGRGKTFLSNSNRFVDAVLGGWQVNAITTLQTGQPIPLLQPVNQAGIYNARQRPNNNGQPATYTSGSTQDKITHWFDSSVFSISAPYTFGNAPRTLTSVRQPGIANIDASLFKNFSILSEHRLDAQLRWEAFNALNHTQFGRVNSTIGTAATGNITSVGVAPRQMQLGLKLIF